MRLGELLLDGGQVGMVQQPVIEPAVHGLAAGLVIVVAEVKPHVTQPVRGAELSVNAFDRRAFELYRVCCLIVCRGDEDLRTRRGHGGDFHVRILDAQSGRILARATALH